MKAIKTHFEAKAANLSGQEEVSGWAELISRHQALEFFKPVEDDVDVTFALISLNHQKALTVWVNVMVLRHAGKLCARHIRSFKQYSRPAGTEGWFRLNGDHHHLVAAAIKNLCPIGRPNWPSAACLPRDQPFDVGFRVGSYIHMVASTRLI